MDVWSVKRTYTETYYEMIRLFWLKVKRGDGSKARREEAKGRKNSKGRPWVP